MPGIRYLHIRFDQNIFPYEIHRFRAAVIEKTRREAPHFHNHDAEGKSIYRYPLIQYKVAFKKASIVCINEGAEEIHHLLKHPDMEFQVGEHINNYEIEDVNLQYFDVQTGKEMFDYSLLNWLALNQEHHRLFRELNDDASAQIQLLKSILTGNILAFAKGIGWSVEERIHVEITRIKHIKPLFFKGRNLLAFTLNFQSNVSLPDFIGLGKGASIGFGVVKRFGKPHRSKSHTT